MLLNSLCLNIRFWITIKSIFSPAECLKNVNRSYFHVHELCTWKPFLFVFSLVLFIKMDLCFCTKRPQLVSQETSFREISSDCRAAERISERGVQTARRLQQQLTTDSHQCQRRGHVWQWRTELQFKDNTLHMFPGLLRRMECSNNTCVYTTDTIREGDVQLDRLVDAIRNWLNQTHLVLNVQIRVFASWNVRSTAHTHVLHLPQLNE